MKKIFVTMAVVAALAAGMTGVVYAQEAPDTHAQAAEAFLMSMKTPQQLEEGINSMVDMMMQSQPTMMPYRQAIKDFYMKYLSWSALKADYVVITKDLLSEQELNDLVEFVLSL